MVHRGRQGKQEGKRRPCAGWCCYCTTSLSHTRPQIRQADQRSLPHAQSHWPPTACLHLPPALLVQAPSDGKVSSARWSGIQRSCGNIALAPAPGLHVPHLLLQHVLAGAVARVCGQQRCGAAWAPRLAGKVVPHGRGAVDVKAGLGHQLEADLHAPPPLWPTCAGAG